MQKRIVNFFNKKYLCTLSTVDGEQPWSFACFYKFDEKEKRLIYLTSEKIKYAQLMMQNPKVSGTVFTSTRFHLAIQGAQFLGVAKMLKVKAEKTARAMYNAEFKPYINDDLSIWEIRLEQVCLIDHSFGRFGKMEWHRGDPDVRDEF